MGRIKKGMILRTSYGTGPYRVIEVTKGCTCPSFTDAVTLLGDAPPSKPHVHCMCRKVGERTGFYWLNGYDENTLQSVWSKDYLIPPDDGLLLTIICML